MSDEKDWESIRPSRALRPIDAGMGLLRVTLLFGSAAVALALLAIPLLDRSDGRHFAGNVFPAGLDMTATGSIGRNVYTVRRSVLQSSPESVCIISASGSRSGDC